MVTPSKSNTCIGDTKALPLVAGQQRYTPVCWQTNIDNYTKMTLGGGGITTEGG